MRYAKDSRTKLDVDAEDVRGTARYRSYSCPVCGARVHFRSSMGLSPDPGFAHNKHAAKPDCELYHPGLGNYIPLPDSWATFRAEMNPKKSACAWRTESAGRRTFGFRRLAILAPYAFVIYAPVPSKLTQAALSTASR